MKIHVFFFFVSSRRRHTRFSRDWSSDVCSSDLAAILGEAAAADTLLEPLRALRPALDSFRPMSPAELGRVHMDPPEPVAGIGNGLLLDSLPADAADALVRSAGEALVSVEVRHLGGALSRAPFGHGA